MPLKPKLKTAINRPAYGIEPGAYIRVGGDSRICENITPTLRGNMGDNQLSVCFLKY